MNRSEYTANESLAARAPQAAWTKPSTARRPAARPCFIRRLFALFI